MKEVDVGSTEVGRLCARTDFKASSRLQKKACEIEECDSDSCEGESAW